MPIRVKCVCGARLKAPDDCMGQSVRCSVCGNAVFVPGARGNQTTQQANQEVQAWIRVVCDCGKVIKSPPEWAGKKGHCPRCGIEHVMPISAPSETPGEHEVEEVIAQADGPKPVKSLAKPAPDSNPADRPAPHPQPRPEGADESGVDDETKEKYVDGQTLRKSGLLDLTGREDVRILDGMAPALWDAKRAQRAKALKSGPEKQTGYYRRRAFTEQLAHIRKRIDEVLYRSPALTLVVSGLFLLGSSLFLYQQMTSTTVREGWTYKASNVYFYDLSTDKLFVHSDTDLPPITAPEQTSDQPMGFRAYVFSCGDCNETGSLFVGYLEMYDPNTGAAAEFRKFRQLMATQGPSSEAAQAESNAEAGRLVSRGKDAKWLQAESEEGQAVITRGSSRDCESGAAPKPCSPPEPAH